MEIDLSIRWILLFLICRRYYFYREDDRTVIDLREWAYAQRSLDCSDPNQLLARIVFTTMNHQS